MSFSYIYRLSCLKFSYRSVAFFNSKFLFANVMNVSHQSVGDACSSNNTRLPIFMPMERRKGQVERKKEEENNGCGLYYIIILITKDTSGVISE